MENQMVRLLKAEEIECRISTVKERGLSLLLYKDARVDQKILDETFGPFGWKRSHQCIDGNLYCTVEVYNKETKAWVSKQDVGTVNEKEKSHAPKEKSQASDAFKRACFNWGIGRELYSAPFIWIPAGMANIQTEGGRFYCHDKFMVSSIGYNDSREITRLSIVDSSGRLVYRLGQEEADKAAKNREKRKTVQKEFTGKSAKTLTESQMRSFEAELKRTGVSINAVKERYKFDSPEGMTEELYNKVMAALTKTRSVA